MKLRESLKGRSTLAWLCILLALMPGLLGEQVCGQERTHPERRGAAAAMVPGGVTSWLSRPVAPYAGTQPFDVLHYRLDLTLPMTTGELSGKCQITLRLTANVDSLRLNAVGLSLDTVWVDRTLRNTRIEPASESFTILLNGTRTAGDTLTVEIFYHRVLGYPRLTSRQGYYYFSKDSFSDPPLPANLGYTMSEPSDARFWMPCYDEPWEKASAEINITVPGGYTAASNGRLIGVSVNGDNTLTWRWREDHQITTYLMCVTCSAFALSAVPYIQAPGDTIPIQYYVWNSAPFTDSAAAAAYLPTVREMMAAFARVYGPYPFDKYGMTAIVPFGYGGMEHQTLTTLNRYLFTNEVVVAHELAHQWWGDLVTCGTWADIWLNESFATYSEAIWQESRGGAGALKSYMENTLTHFFFSSWSGAVYNPVGQGFDLFDDVVYSKGAWVLHTLRGVLGDSSFFAALTVYRERFAGKSAVTDEFKAAVESAAGRDMGWFFDEWIYGRGWPRYASRYNNTRDSLLLTVYQMQDSTLGNFKMPLQVRAYYRGDSTSFVVWDSLRVQQFKMQLAYVPDSIALDPDGWILKEIVRPPTSVAGNERPLKFSLSQNYPNPFNPTTHIGFVMRDLGFVSLKVYDVLGREVATLVNEVKQPGTYEVEFSARGGPTSGGDGRELSSGVYLYRLITPGFTQTRKMLLVR